VKGKQPMMNNPTDPASGMPSSAVGLKEQSKQGLREFFQQKSVKNLVNVLVPSALAAVLFPVFGPAVAAGAVAVAVQNGLKLLGISFSADSVAKMLKPLEGKQIGESDVQAVLEDMLPKDKQVNDEAAKALVTVVPELKEAALANPRLDSEWLGQSLEISLHQQGLVMEQVAPHVRDLIQLDKREIEMARDRLLADWSRITEQVTASDYGEVNDVKQHARGGHKDISLGVSASGHGKITRVDQSYEQT